MKTEVTVVETLRRRVVVKHPETWTADDIYEYVCGKYMDCDIVLDSGDFDGYELFVGDVAGVKDETSPDYEIQ